jgi:uncharacterized membrane-anchored protein
MNGFWSRLKLSLRITLLVLLVAYLMALMLFNSGQVATIWLYPTQERSMSILMLAAVSFVGGAIMALVGWTTIRSLLRSPAARERHDRKLKNEIADLNRKALRLQTRVATPQSRAAARNQTATKPIAAAPTVVAPQSATPPATAGDQPPTVAP